MRTTEATLPPVLPAALDLAGADASPLVAGGDRSSAGARRAAAAAPLGRSAGLHRSIAPTGSGRAPHVVGTDVRGAPGRAETLAVPASNRHGETVTRGLDLVVAVGFALQPVGAGGPAVRHHETVDDPAVREVDVPAAQQLRPPPKAPQREA